MTTPALKRLLAATIAVCLVGGLIATRVVGGDDADLVATGAAAAIDDGQEEASTPAAGSDDTEAAPADAPAAAADAVTADGAAPAGSTAPPTSRPPAPRTSGGSPGSSTPPARATGDEPGPPAATATPPRDGAYRYRTQSNGESSEGEAKVETLSRSEGEVRQRIELPGGAGVSGEFVWRPAEVVLTSIAILACDPPVLVYRTPLEAGASWSSNSTCKGTFRDQEVSADVASSVTVVRAETVTVGGRPVATWVLERRLTTTSTIPQANCESTSTEWFAPSIGLTVKGSSTRTPPTPTGCEAGETSYEMLSVDPV